MDCPLGCGEIPASATADELFAMYDRTLRDIADQFAPERTVQSKLRPLSPWFDSECHLPQLSSVGAPLQTYAFKLESRPLD